MAEETGASETDPLLSKQQPTSWLDCCKRKPADPNQKELDEVEPITDEMTYQPGSLLRWSSLLMPHGSIWRSHHLWSTMLRLAVLVVIISIIVVFTVPDPVSLKIEHFLKISYFLNFFVGLCVSFFMKSSLERWHNCTEGFLELGDAIRNLQMQFQALGASEERSDMCSRYGLLSGHLLRFQLIYETQSPGETKETKQKMWEELTLQSKGDAKGIQPKVDHDELKVLTTVSDPAGVMWNWISSLVARMAEDGEIPGMATPTYGRIMNLCQDAHDGIRHVRSSISVRAPFVYVHMLASLVHINNLLNAVSLGLVFGVAISGRLLHAGHHPLYQNRVRGNQVERDESFCVVTIIVCSLGPLFYQAITEISIALSQPFSSKFGQIPTERILHTLEEVLGDGKIVSRNLPHWERPRFKPA
jgi:hypothetical protein